MRLIVENTLVRAPLFRCVRLGGGGQTLIADVSFPRFPKLLQSLNIFQAICEWP